jgi:hypothetical protein
MIYLDTSVALAHLLAEDRCPSPSMWDHPLVSSRLLEYEIWTSAASGTIRASGRDVAEDGHRQPWRRDGPRSDAGVLQQISRGVYRLADLPPLAEPDLVTVALRVPKAVIALVSALHFHGLTTEIPHEVSIALPLRAANVCRVRQVVRPYLEGLQ